MASDGEFMGLALALAGLWVLDSVVKGRGPLSSLKGILSSTPGTTGADASTYDGSLPSLASEVSSPNLSTVLGATSSAAVGISGTVQAAVAYAVAQVGKPYQWGATGPNAFDCSGLMQAAYNAAGVSISRTTYTQILDGSPVSGGLLPGDLVFPDTGHVEMVISTTQTVQAPHTGAVVEIGPIPTYIAARRIVSSTATAPTTASELFLP